MWFRGDRVEVLVGEDKGKQGYINFVVQVKANFGIVTYKNRPDFLLNWEKSATSFLKRGLCYKTFLRP
jgi:hypothetical protein